MRVFVVEVRYFESYIGELVYGQSQRHNERPRDRSTVSADIGCIGRIPLGFILLENLSLRMVADDLDVYEAAQVEALGTELRHVGEGKNSTVPMEDGRREMQPRSQGPHAKTRPDWGPDSVSDSA